MNLRPVLSGDCTSPTGAVRPDATGCNPIVMGPWGIGAGMGPVCPSAEAEIPAINSAMRANRCNIFALRQRKGRKLLSLERLGLWETCSSQCFGKSPAAGIYSRKTQCTTCGRGEAPAEPRFRTKTSARRQPRPPHAMQLHLGHANRAEHAQHHQRVAAGEFLSAR